MNNEFEKFKEDLEIYFEEWTEITSTKESIITFLEELESNSSNCEDAQIRGNYDLLSGFICLQYFDFKEIDGPDLFEDELCERGLEYATRAVSVCGDDEYRLLHNIFRIVNVSPETGTDAITELQRLITECPAIVNLQETVIPIYEWEDIFENMIYTKLLVMYDCFEDLSDQVKLLLSYDFESTVYKEHVYSLISKIYYRMEDYSNHFEYAKAVVELGDSVEGENKKPSNSWLESLVDLGGCYEEGEGVEKDAKKAFEIYNRGAELGSGYAMACIGDMYENGVSVELDREIAYSWYNKAVAAGYEDAQEDIDRLKEYLKKDFYLKVVDVISVEDRGTVVTGRIESGCICVGDKVVISRQVDNTTVIGTIIGIEIFRKLLDCAEFGDNVGILLQQDDSLSGIASGDIVSYYVEDVEAELDDFFDEELVFEENCTNEFANLKNRVDAIVKKYREVREKNNVEEKGLSASVERKAAPFINGNFTLAIVGKMSAGKSTFINAFLGNKNILPTGHFQTTCVLTKVEYSEEESIEIIYGDDSKEVITGDISGKLNTLVAIEDQYSSLPVNAINKLIVKGFDKSKICSSEIVKGLEETSRRAIDMKVLESYIENHPKSKIVKEVTVKYPLHDNCEGWRIVDTPGVEAVGGIDVETMNFLTERNDFGGNNVDAIIFLHRGTDHIEDKSINDFVKKTFKSLSEDAKKRIFFVVTNAANEAFQNNEEKYMSKAKALFVEQYGIKEERLIPVDSLMEILHHYTVAEKKDAVSLMGCKEVPDSSWDMNAWKICRGLLRDIKDTLEDAGKSVNNENLLAIVKEWSNFDKLREILNEFVKSEKANAYEELMQTIREDIRQSVNQRKNDIALLQKGAQEVQGQMQALAASQLEMNEMLTTIQQQFSKETVAGKFNFVEQKINDKILASDVSYTDIRRETVNIYDLVDERKKELYNQMISAFKQIVQVSASKVFFRRPDFESIETKATKEATEILHKKGDKRVIPGFCCDDYEEYTENVETVNESRKLREFKTMAVRHIRQEYRRFQEEIQNEVDEYISNVNDSLRSSIDSQQRHLNEILNKYQVSSKDELQGMIRQANREVVVFDKFINSIEKY